MLPLNVYTAHVYRPERRAEDADAYGQAEESERLLATVQARIIQSWAGEDDQIVRAESNEARTEYQVILSPLDVEVRERDRVKYTESGTVRTLHVQRVYRGPRYWTLWTEEYKIGADV